MYSMYSFFRTVINWRIQRSCDKDILDNHHLKIQLHHNLLTVYNSVLSTWNARFLCKDDGKFVCACCAYCS